MDAVEQFLLDFQAEKFGGELFEPNLVASSGMNVGEILAIPGAQYVKTLTYDGHSTLQLIHISVSALMSFLLILLFLYLQVHARFVENREVDPVYQAICVFKAIAVFSGIGRLLMLYAQRWSKSGSLIETIKTGFWHWEEELVFLIVLATVLIFYIVDKLDVVQGPPGFLEEEGRL
ncbi:uncharacterized protein PAC_02056 [Phialocephala subalpina]|uniref:Uncharacterized protein n=1 Tax=Phialocephala subalpina TaxID=576137 RepID=A0A1L7WHD1_9HELO|nr:uncharacterized protein PAC_02056 [Phialocephala subalpina]